MADQEAYQSTMRDAASAAWDHDWDTAARLYQQAIQLNPNDSQALAGLGLSLMESGKHPEALQVYERVSQLVPNDPLPFEKMAEILELMNKLSDAAKRYLGVAEIYFARKDVAHAIPNWEKAAGLDPELPQPHMRLGVAYEQSAETRPQAIIEYVMLAQLLQQFNQLPKAEQALQHAMQLDPTNQDVRSALDDFRRGNKLQVMKQPSRQKKEKPSKKKAAEPEPSPDDGEIQRTPVDEAAHYALGLLADLVFTGDVPQAGVEPLVKAIDLHQIGAAEDAIDAYNQALKSGLNHPALSFNLGLLYFYSDQADKAIPLLDLASGSPDYGTAANLMLGQIFYGRKDIFKGADYLIQALQLADTSINDRVDTGGYVRLLSGLKEQPVEFPNDLCKAVTLYLDDPRWKNKLSDTLGGFAGQGKSSYVTDLIELVIEGGRPEVSAVMERIDLYLSRNMIRMALEEAHYAIERSPDYLPAHRRLADILVKEGRNQEAAFKLNLVGETYLVRGNADKAADLFAEVIELWPADMDARQKVIDMLRIQGRIDDAVKQYAELGDFHYRMMTDTTKAAEVFSEGLAYAKKNSAAAPGVIAILKSLADIESQQLNWRKALDYNQQIVELAPDEQEAALAVVDLNFQSGDAAAAITALDAYIRYCITHGHTDRIIRTLEDMARRYPNEVALRQRLADVYIQAKRTQDAIAQMDAIGELLLDAGRVADAADVIRKIIDLQPADIEGYQQLLAQLETGSR
jgi:tetratricopeptide (TPR) repeat protein